MDVAVRQAVNFLQLSGASVAQTRSKGACEVTERCHRVRKSCECKSPADSGAAKLQTSSSVNISTETSQPSSFCKGDVRVDGRFGPCATFNSIRLNLKKFKM